MRAEVKLLVEADSREGLQAFAAYNTKLPRHDYGKLGVVTVIRAKVCEARRGRRVFSRRSRTEGWELEKVFQRGKPPALRILGQPRKVSGRKKGGRDATA